MLNPPKPKWFFEYFEGRHNQLTWQPASPDTRWGTPEPGDIALFKDTNKTVVIMAPSALAFGGDGRITMMDWDLWRTGMAPRESIYDGIDADDVQVLASDDMSEPP